MPKFVELLKFQHCHMTLQENYFWHSHEVPMIVLLSLYHFTKVFLKILPQRTGCPDSMASYFNKSCAVLFIKQK